MSMRSYINAHCEAAAYDPHYRSSDFFGGGEDYPEDSEYASAGETSERVAIMVKGAAEAFPDDFELAKLYASSTNDPNADRSAMPQKWQDGLRGLDADERGVLSSALAIPVLKLGIGTVGIVRNLPETELRRIKGIGEGKASILKALGHQADRETTLELVIEEDALEAALGAQAVAA